MKPFVEELMKLLPFPDKHYYAFNLLFQMKQEVFLVTQQA